MPAVLALVNVLEFLYVQDYRSRIMDDDGYHHTPQVSRRSSNTVFHSRNRFTVEANPSLVLEFDVESAPTSRAMPEELHQEL
ncbi:hypothetical protein E6H25_06725 [Candidatus Bathyarchaeota archaeon]|nr:MAG: hypothetical protein E6H25_06725 [Candidatus Bathyarchaeota archaeon]